MILEVGKANCPDVVESLNDSDRNSPVDEDQAAALAQPLTNATASLTAADVSR